MDTSIDQDIETPIPLVDLDRMERNLDRMAAYTALHGLRLRPHIKTHKSGVVAEEQLRRGAVGVTCATLREAEVMSGVCDDVLLAYPPVGQAKLERLLALPDSAHITVALDSREAIDGLWEAARDSGRKVRVMIEMDAGMHRVGVASVEEAIALASHIESSTELEYVGINFYPGHVREDVAHQADKLSGLTRWIANTLGALDAAGLAPKIVSGGSTPTAYRTHELPGVTEMRPGTYVYNDRSTAMIGACEMDDCALTVLATVVSTAVPGQAVIDAGTKALGREPLRATGGDGFGALLEHPEVVVRTMSEEHGILELAGSAWKPRVGEQVRVIPNHVCIVVHLNDMVYGVRDGRVETSWMVEARGR